MKFVPGRLAGVFRIELEEVEDDRGFFARSWSIDEAEAHGLNVRVVQCNVSFNRRRGTLRGLHYQVAPHEEAKLVRVTRGALIDVLLDVRRDSPTYRQWERFELTDANRSAVYVPEGVAHGFQTLTDQTEVFYQISAGYAPEFARGVRWNDPAFNIDWPLPDPILSARDAAFPDFVS